MSTNKEVQEKPATTLAEESAVIPIAQIASTAEWNHQVTILNRKSTDLVNTDVVAQGYMLHGHPASMGFINLNKMTASRMRKQFPFFDRKDPLFAMLEAKLKYIVGQGILKKYEYRKRGEYIDYAKWIDKEWAKLLEEFRTWKPSFLELTDGATQDDNV